MTAHPAANSPTTKPGHDRRRPLYQHGAGDPDRPAMALQPAQDALGGAFAVGRHRLAGLEPFEIGGEEAGDVASYAVRVQPGAVRVLC